MNNDKTKYESETFYMAILIAFGPDPEAHVSQPSPIFRKWQAEVQIYVGKFAKKQPDWALEWFNDYYDWLGDRKMGWKPEEGSDE